MSSCPGRACHGSVHRAAASAVLTFTVPSGEAAAADQLHTQRQASRPDTNGDAISSEPAVFYLDPLKAIKVNASVHRIM